MPFQFAYRNKQKHTQEKQKQPQTTRARSSLIGTHREEGEGGTRGQRRFLRSCPILAIFDSGTKTMKKKTYCFWAVLPFPLFR